MLLQVREQAGSLAVLADGGLVLRALGQQLRTLVAGPAGFGRGEPVAEFVVAGRSAVWQRSRAPVDTARFRIA